MLNSRNRVFMLARVVFGAAALALASQFEIPFEPVPVTLQSLAVVLIGFWLSPVRGIAAIVLWLAAGALGLPMFAGGEGGIDHLTGPTAGYLVSFPLAAALAGYLGAARDRSSFPRLLLAAVAAHILILGLGGAWLATRIGASAALEKGVLPFILGAVIKSAIAAVLAYLIGRRRN